MKNLYVKYNPYLMKTFISIDGKDIPENSLLFPIINGKRMQEWVDVFPEKLVEILNSREFDITFHGFSCDKDDFIESFQQAIDKGVVSEKTEIKYEPAKSEEDVTGRIIEIFSDLQEGPIDEFRDPKLTKAFEIVKNSVFPINVIATMSSGKSTLINALLQKCLMPSENQACTARITEILDNDNDVYTAKAYSDDLCLIAETNNLTYEKMVEYNKNDEISNIYVMGDIPFLSADEIALKIVDTPGPNNSRNQAHKTTTYRAINNDSHSLVIYVLNGAQLGTNDDDCLLSYVAEEMKKGGKDIRDRFIFVINRMDDYDPSKEDIGKAVEHAKNYLESHGIVDPLIFPCSAKAALTLRTNLDEALEKDEDERTDDEDYACRQMRRFNKYESLHFEKMSKLSPTDKNIIQNNLNNSIQNNNKKEQALIHSGIYSIEAAIKTYVKKYAKTKKVKDLIETFKEILETSENLAKAKNQIVNNQKVADACAKRAKKIKKIIENGEEAKKFRNEIKKLNSMKRINKRANSLMEEVSKTTTKLFKPYGVTINDRTQAKRLIDSFKELSSDCIAKMSAELESAINNDLIDVGNEILKQYAAKLSKLDEIDSDIKLDFNTFDLIKNRLRNLREDSKKWCYDGSSQQLVEDVGTVTEEVKEYYEKVGEEEEQVAAGTEDVYIGEKEVSDGYEQVIKTRTIKNPDKEGFFGKLKFWLDDYIDDDYIEWREKYRKEPVYKTIIKYETIMRDVFEKREEKIERYEVKVSDLQTGLVTPLKLTMESGVKDALEFAEVQCDEMKEQFCKSLDGIDKYITAKYSELEKCCADQELKQKTLNENKKILKWIQDNNREIDEVLDI